MVSDYLAKAGFTPYLDELGFNLVGYGCTTCIGNSGPLPDPIETAIKKAILQLGQCFLETVTLKVVSIRS